MSYKTYEKYVDSHIKWFNEIPEHWNLLKIKNMIEYYINGAWGSEKQNDINDIICIRIADFDYPKRNIKDIDYTIRNISLNKKLLLKPGDLLIEKSGGGENQPVGRVVIFDKEFKATFSNFISKLKIKERYDSRFLCYMFNMLYSSKVNTKSIKQTTGIQNLDSYAYFDEIIAIPDIIEQQQIANYLDKKTTKIDETIAKNQQLIELLEEKRTALINQVVTKGLNPDVPMKDSGVEWICEIPENWEINPLKNVTDIIMGQSPNSEDINDDGQGILFMQGNADFTDKYPHPTEYCSSPKKISREGDILMSVRAPVGELNISDKRYGIGRGLCSIKPTKVNQTYLWYYLQKSKTDFDYYSTGSTFDAITIGNLSSFPITIPKLSEQKQIADFLDKEISNIYDIINKITENINLLEEYKTSLIHHVVTGKIDVRGEEI